MILSNLKMEVGHAEEKVSSMRGEHQHLPEAIASIFVLPSFEKRISKISPTIGILRVPLEDYSECRDGLLDVLFFSS